MAGNKKYYFLKLKEDFFDQREIVVLEGSKDGILYVNILLKLYLKSLQHNGKLLLNEITPLSAEMIALLTRHEVGTVERAMRAFMQLGLVEVLEDNIFYMPEIEEMTGKPFKKLFIKSAVLHTQPCHVWLKQIYHFLHGATIARYRLFQCIKGNAPATVFIFHDAFPPSAAAAFLWHCSSGHKW